MGWPSSMCTPRPTFSPAWCSPLRCPPPSAPPTWTTVPLTPSTRRPPSSSTPMPPPQGSWATATPPVLPPPPPRPPPVFTRPSPQGQAQRPPSCSTPPSSTSSQTACSEERQDAGSPIGLGCHPGLPMPQPGLSGNGLREGLLHCSIRMNPLLVGLERKWEGFDVMVGWEARIKHVVTEGFQMQTLHFYYYCLSFIVSMLVSFYYQCNYYIFLFQSTKKPRYILVFEESEGCSYLDIDPSSPSSLPGHGLSEGTAAWIHSGWAFGGRHGANCFHPHQR
ncbi:hypothetical protein J4Q44_G00102240 [Coregonus suidteri]|uniref:Uncharacterized protein n=1 Tax=Coregonus suidteri TaxID=861788 RepID=A0AAN8LX02_9TELE